ncbi:energy-coupling factor ABC transporter ATP-binding protein [Microbacterium sp. YY-01]|uniref:energy-coupling factor ABC transporter ATP-binding protein n=1 Tax=Microbacterium sp. YY-01 TaxID=3421634 RepID=UPI003D1874FD
MWRRRRTLAAGAAAQHPESADPTEHVIDVRDVGVTADGHRVLNAVSVTLRAPTTAVIGANGSGKSTFARLLNGLVLPTTGNVVVHGDDTQHARERVRSHVGFIFANPEAQILMPTAREDIALSLRSHGVAKNLIDEQTQRVLENFRLHEHADQPAYSLSGGQKQLLALAAVLSTSPTVLVADEPTTLLDLAHSTMMSDLLIDSVTAQRIIVTHDLELAARCDEAILFDGGTVTAHGEVGDVIGQYRRSYA